MSSEEKGAKSGGRMLGSGGKDDLSGTLSSSSTSAAGATTTRSHESGEKEENNHSTASVPSVNHTGTKSKSRLLDPTPEESSSSRSHEREGGYETQHNGDHHHHHHHREGERNLGGGGGRYDSYRGGGGGGGGDYYDSRHRDRGDYGRYSNVPNRDRDRDRERPFQQYHGSYSRGDRYYSASTMEERRHSHLYDPYHRHGDGIANRDHDFDRMDHRSPQSHQHHYRHPSEGDREANNHYDFHDHGRGGMSDNNDHHHYDRGGRDWNRDRYRHGGGGFGRASHDYDHDFEGRHTRGRDRDRDRDTDYDRDRYQNNYRNGRGYSQYDNDNEYHRGRPEYGMGDRHNYRGSDRDLDSQNKDIGESSDEHVDLNCNRNNSRDDQGSRPLDNNEPMSSHQSDSHDNEKETRREERFRQRFGKSREYHHDESGGHKSNDHESESEARREERFHQRFGSSKEYHHDETCTHQASTNSAENEKQTESKRENRFHERFGKSREYHHTQTAAANSTDMNNPSILEKTKINHEQNWRVQVDHDETDATSDQQFRVASTLDQVKEEAISHEPMTIMKRPIGASSGSTTSVVGAHLSSSMPSIQEAAAHQAENSINERIVPTQSPQTGAMDSSGNDLHQKPVLLDGTSSQIEENKETSKENLRGLTVEEQQQNILRQVQATRAERTKHELVSNKNAQSFAT